MSPEKFRFSILNVTSRRTRINPDTDPKKHPDLPFCLGGVTSDFKVTARPAAASLTMAGWNDQNPMTR
jgi:hypothetical protein